MKRVLSKLYPCRKTAGLVGLGIVEVHIGSYLREFHNGFRSQLVLCDDPTIDLNSNIENPPHRMNA